MDQMISRPSTNCDNSANLILKNPSHSSQPYGADRFHILATTGSPAVLLSWSPAEKLDLQFPQIVFQKLPNTLLDSS